MGREILKFVASLIVLPALIDFAAASDAAKKFSEAGKKAAITVVPTRLAGVSTPQVSEVIAMFLERGGMTNLETSSNVFTPPDGDLAKTAAAFAEFIRKQPVDTQYAMFADFLGSPEKGASEIRGVIVNRAGEIVWQDKQAKGDAEFDAVKPREPMQCCTLLVNRLRPVLKLDDPVHGKPGPIAERFQKNSGLPDKTELAAMQKRQAAFKKSASHSTLLIYPARAGGSFSAESGTQIATQLNDKKLINATAAKSGPQINVPGSINEQKVLWSMAHALSDHVKKNPPNADYVLIADYLMGKNAVGGVHFAICNKQGELVIVDFQNSHSPDFKAINAKSREDCDQLVVKRLQAYCN